MKALIYGTVFFSLSTQAFADDARKDKVNCSLELRAGKKVSFVMPLTDYQDKDLAIQDDGAEGKATVEGYHVRYVTAAGTADCPECKTGATRIFYSTLSLSKGKVSEEEEGAVFGDATLTPKKLSGVKSVACQYVADPNAQ